MLGTTPAKPIQNEEAIATRDCKLAFAPQIRIGDISTANDHFHLVVVLGTRDLSQWENELTRHLFG